MRELIKDVAEVISNLVTLNLLCKKDIETAIKLNPTTKKNEMAVTVYIANQELLCLCLELFQELSAKNGQSKRLS